MNKKAIPPSYVKISCLIAPKSLLKTKKKRISVLKKLFYLCLPYYQQYPQIFACLPSYSKKALSHIEKNKLCDFSIIPEISAHLKKQKLIGNYPFLAALCTNSLIPLDKAKYDAWLGLTLLCCLQLHCLGGHNSAIKNALRQIRLVATKEFHSDLLTILPDVTTFDSLDALLQKLKDIREQLENKTHDKHQYLDNFCFLQVAIRDAIEKSPSINRPKKSKNKEESQFELTIDEKYEGQIAELKTAKEPSTAQEEDEDLSVNKMQTYRCTEPMNQSNAFNKHEGKNLLKHFKRRQLSLPTDPNQLTEYDVRCLANYCVNNISDDSACWLLISLLLGRSFEFLTQKHRQKPIFFINDEFPYYQFEHKLPVNKLSRAFKKFLRETTPEIKIALPTMLAEWISKEEDLIINYEDIKQTLRKINHEKGTNLTVKKTISFLNHYLTNQGVDNAVIALLRNDSYISEPAIAYTCFEQHNPQSCHREFTEYIFSLTTKQNSEIAADISSELHTGSPLFVNDDICSDFFSFLASKVNSRLNWFHFHNHFLLYTLALLVFSLGHRDVNAPLGKISDYNPYFGTWYISDKVCRSSLSARTLYLPATAIKQIDSYLQHLKALIKSTKFIEPEIMQHCINALEGKNNLFFAIVKKQDKFVAVDITPSSLDKLYQFKIPFPHNWSRHYFRSFFTQKKVSGELINAWMGHQSSGAEAFGKHSGLAINDLKIISQLIENKIRQLNIREIKGWGKHH